MRPAASRTLGDEDPTRGWGDAARGGAGSLHGRRAVPIGPGRVGATDGDRRARRRAISEGGMDEAAAATEAVRESIEIGDS